MSFMGNFQIYPLPPKPHFICKSLLEGANGNQKAKLESFEEFRKCYMLSTCIPCIHLIYNFTPSEYKQLSYVQQIPVDDLYDLQTSMISFDNNNIKLLVLNLVFGYYKKVSVYLMNKKS